MFIEIIYETWRIIQSAGPYLLFGFLAAGLIHVLISTAWIASQLGKRNWKSVFLASFFGIPLPLCSCSVIPTAATIRQKGASRGATSSFLISTPETGIDSLALTYAMMDWVMTIMRPIAAFFTALFAGLFINQWGEKEEIKQGEAISKSCCSSDTSQEITDSTPCCSDEESSCCCADSQETSDCCCSETNEKNPHTNSCCSSQKDKQTSSCCSTMANTSVSEACCSQAPDETSRCCHEQQSQNSSSNFKQSRIYQTLHFAFVDLAGDLAHWLLLGFIISGIIGALLPPGIFEGWLGQGFISLILMLIVAMPMYICASASTPVAAMLIAKGLSPGAALVFLMAGPATNLGTLPIVAKLLGKRATIIYLTAIIIGALMAGAFVNYFYQWMEISTSMHVEEHAMGEGSVIHILSGIVLIFLMLKGIISRPMPKEWRDVFRSLKKPLRSSS